ncbi:MAG TPA: hypothetical protein VFS61_11640 [Anaerolineales bacterium]|nr:hypothetical protein [Anaerolineales bacterium]
MFNFFKKKEKPPSPVTIRDTLFGDMPLSGWPSDSGLNMEPWSFFVQARQHLDKKDRDSAIAILKKITDMPGLESRHYLQAWHFLRQLGVTPPADKAKITYGVIVEVAVQGGADLVAAYTDHTARYLHHTGGGVIWERPDTSLDAEIEALLKAGQAVANVIGPWEQERPPAPQGDGVRLNMLTPSGLHFGYGSFKTLYDEPMGRSIIDPATQLMQGLIAKDKRR